MRSKHTFIAALSLAMAALACGPLQGDTGLTQTPLPPVVVTATTESLPPAPTQDGSGAGGTPISNEPGGDNTVEGFRQALLDNIISRNYNFLLYTMNDPFTINAWRGGGGALTPSEATTKLSTELLPPDNIVNYTLDKDITALLDGTPPQDAFGPDVNIVDAVFMDGWGPDGNGEVILFISQSAEGVFAWHGIVYASQGFK